jgi:hypothetical protein
MMGSMLVVVVCGGGADGLDALMRRSDAHP